MLIVCILSLLLVAAPHLGQVLGGTDYFIGGTTMPGSENALYGALATLFVSIVGLSRLELLSPMWAFNYLFAMLI